MAAPQNTAPFLHPLRSPLWLLFALCLLAIPSAMMVPKHWWSTAPPLPHLARLPDLSLVQSGGERLALHSGSPMFVDITSEPCGPPCASRTGVFAAMGHSDNPPAMLSVLGAPPEDHPVLLAAAAIVPWRIAWPARAQQGRLSELQDAWVAARAHLPATTLPTGGVMLVDGSGSVRGVYAASDNGIQAALGAWTQLSTESDTTP